MNSNQINTSGNGSIVAISLAVITSVTTVVTTIVNKDDNTNKKPEVVASTVVTPPAPVPTVHSLKGHIDSLTKKLNNLENRTEKYKSFNNNALFDIVSLLDLDEKTRTDFYDKLRVKMLLAESQNEFDSLNSFKDTFLHKLKLK